MSEQQNNNEKKTNEKCQCTKKIMALEKAINELQIEVSKQSKLIATMKKVLKRG